MLMPSFKALLSSILLAGAAVAAGTDGPYSLGLAPVGIEKGLLNTTLDCDVTALGLLPLGKQKIGFGVYAFLPGRVSINQPFSIVASTRLIVPASLNGLAGLLGAKYYSGTVDSVVVNTPGASPSSTDVAKNANLTIPAAILNTKGVSVLEVPGPGKSIIVGPLTASKDGNVVISFGAISASITTLDARMNKSLISAKVVCAAQKRPISVAAITVGGNRSTKPIVPKGGGGKIPTIPEGQTAGVTGFNYICDFSGFIRGPVRVSLGAVKASNAQVASGGKITLAQGQGNIILSQKLVDDIKAIVSIADHTTLTLTTVNLVASNASPATQNIIPAGGISVSNVAIAAGAVAVIPPGAPQQTLPDINFTAGESGSTALISIGDAAGNASLRDSDDNEILAIDFTCAALSPNVPVFPYDIQ
ncbi:unnamed protein product [Tilletia controversa]|uniref:Uncharacterized protein n=4 Tax=Tilletia TaxID=13289 RepID=A0A8X7MZB9_9BASI|nr:hypothetical protein CF336_g4628 [Tilletia laevis]KAE8199763.1 hypothetical protein CF328_g3151 [Tilletia controversa]CAD6890391.1 unnamed protein product [Tilletia caries]KAE8253313.1 hypothetical protein A4X06_0g1546 [Tilletia controversa]CAD6901676.1 unnamed protein product [Tilletia controversa]